MLLRPGFGVWWCIAVVLISFVVHASAFLGLVGGESLRELAIAALSGGVTFWLIVRYGYLLTQHVRFRLRHHVNIRSCRDGRRRHHHPHRGEPQQLTGNEIRHALSSSAWWFATRILARR